MQVFGDEVGAAMLQQTLRANLNFAGVVARALYVCTSIVGGIPCGRNAVMSALFEFQQVRVHWHCDRCSASADANGEKGRSRSLLLYPLVEMKGGCKPMPMRALACRVYLQAPPDEFSLGVLDRLVSSLVSSVVAVKSKPAILQSTGKRNYFCSMARKCFQLDDCVLVAGVLDSLMSQSQGVLASGSANGFCIF
jgi:hypothetical protein